MHTPGGLSALSRLTRQIELDLTVHDLAIVKADRVCPSGRAAPRPKDRRASSVAMCGTGPKRADDEEDLTHLLLRMMHRCPLGRAANDSYPAAHTYLTQANSRCSIPR
jgi:hypothetical protein